MCTEKNTVPLPCNTVACRYTEGINGEIQEGKGGGEEKDERCLVAFKACPCRQQKQPNTIWSELTLKVHFSRS